MRLHKRLASALVATMVLTSMPVATMASDYESHWANEAIDKWKNKNIVEGFEDGSFRPSETITNAQFAKILVELMGYNTTENSAKFTDVLEDKWYTDYVTKISAAGIMYEPDDTFKPHTPITREEAAYALVNAYKLADAGSAKTAFTDATKISDWATEAVTTLYNAGYIKGNPDGSFNPKGTLTRAELITMIDRMNSDVVNTSGNYSNDVAGNLVVNTPGVVLKDMTIDGDLYVAEGIGDGELEMENVTVNGRVIVEGGGVNSLRANKKCKFNGAFLVYAKNPVRIVIYGDKVDVHIMANTQVVLTGNFDTVYVGAGSKLILDNAKVDTITADESGKAPIIEIRSNSVVQKLVANVRVVIQGNGRLVELIANVRGVSSSIRPERASGSDSGSISYGDSSNDWDNYDEKGTEDDDKVKEFRVTLNKGDYQGKVYFKNDPVGSTIKATAEEVGKMGNWSLDSDAKDYRIESVKPEGNTVTVTIVKNTGIEKEYDVTVNGYSGALSFNGTRVENGGKLTTASTETEIKTTANWSFAKQEDANNYTITSVAVSGTQITVTVDPVKEGKNTVKGNTVWYVPNSGDKVNVSTALNTKITVVLADGTQDEATADKVDADQAFTLTNLDKTKKYVVKATYNNNSVEKTIEGNITEPITLEINEDEGKTEPITGTVTTSGASLKVMTGVLENSGMTVVGSQETDKATSKYSIQVSYTPTATTDEGVKKELEEKINKAVNNIPDLKDKVDIAVLITADGKLSISITTPKQQTNTTLV